MCPHSSGSSGQICTPCNHPLAHPLSCTGHTLVSSGGIAVPLKGLGLAGCRPGACRGGGLFSSPSPCAGALCGMVGVNAANIFSPRHGQLFDW